MKLPRRRFLHLAAGAACCNVWNFATLGWQLTNKYYTDCRNSWKGRDDISYKPLFANDAGRGNYRPDRGTHFHQLRRLSGVGRDLLGAPVPTAQERKRVGLMAVK